MDGSTDLPRPACPLCGETHFQTISKLDRRRKPLDTVICRRCGLVSHARIPTDQELADFYKRRYRKVYNGRHTPSAHRVAREWQRSSDRVRKIRHLLSRGDRVFEVGSGIGCTLKQLELAGFTAKGIEPGEGFARYSREILHVDVEERFLSELPPTGDQQLVLLTHVLEHLPKPIEALQSIRGLLEPGGYLFVEVPNLQAPHTAVNRMFHVGHIYNFVPATLAGIGQLAGFEVAQTFSGPLDGELSILFRSVDKPSRPLVFNGYDQAMEGLNRFNRLNYYVRPAYVWKRCKIAVQRIGERMTARQKLNRILAKCRETTWEMTNDHSSFFQGFGHSPH